MVVGIKEPIKGRLLLHGKLLWGGEKDLITVSDLRGGDLTGTSFLRLFCNPILSVFPQTRALARILHTQKKKRCWCSNTI